MKARLLLVLALGVLATLPGAALGDSSRRAANSVTFPDSIGEDPRAPDITSVVVSNDDAGNLAFGVNVSNRPALTADMYFVISLDSDQNAATGSVDLQGVDHMIRLKPGALELFRWDGSDFVAAPSQASLSYSYSAGGPTIRVNAAELGKTKGFRFQVYAVSGLRVDPTGRPDLTNIHRDVAPDPGQGFFTYRVLTKLVLTVTRFTIGPKPARAGRPFSASLVAITNGGEAVQGTAACAATIAFKRVVAVSHVVAHGVASCVWPIPSTAKGKMLRGTITLTAQGVKVARSFSSRIS